MKIKPGKSAVLLDRDGVINASPAGRYVTSWEEFHFLPGALPALRRLKNAGKTVLIVSNQAGVGRGILSRTKLDQITRKMLQAIRAAGGIVQTVYYCTHRPKAACACRKPKIGMLRKAAREHRLDLTRSFLVGDHEKDIELNTARFAAAMERMIRLYPEQWLWIHRRWKTRPPGEPGLYD